MMAGIVFATVGAGFRVAAGTIGDDVQRAFTVVGVILFSLGIGFLFAALMAFVVSSRLGLFPAAPGAAIGLRPCVSSRSPTWNASAPSTKPNGRSR